MTAHTDCIEALALTLSPAEMRWLNLETQER